MNSSLGIRRAAHRYWQAWLARRLPRQREVLLDQRRIFVFPSRTGFGFLLTLTVMLLAAINYQNNLALALVSWLLGLMLVSILHAFMNLSGLRITALRGHPAFAGDTARFDLELRCRGGRPRKALQVSWPGVTQQTLALLERRAEISLYYPAARRGWLRPPHLRIASTYPLGLIQAWSWVELDWQALIYPRPRPGGPPPLTESQMATGRAARIRVTGDEFHGLRDYQTGDSLRHILWKSYARGGPLQTRQLAEDIEDSLWLDYHSTPGHPEARLEHLCHWVLVFSRQARPFGLRLSGQHIEPGAGAIHRHRVLEALALFGAHHGRG